MAQIRMAVFLEKSTVLPDEINLEDNAPPNIPPRLAME
jgi:hypothetical protein